MHNEFFYLLIESMHKSLYRVNDIEAECISDKEYDEIYNKILDRLVHNIFFEAVEDELLLSAFNKLRRLEKIIVVFYIMLDYDASEVADIANTSVDSIYTQKYKAVKRLRKALGIGK